MNNGALTPHKLRIGCRYSERTLLGMGQRKKRPKWTLLLKDDLLNAIETRSQTPYGSFVRYGPMKKAPEMDAFIYGPRGIRTLDLLNAIETRSQLRYGP